MGSHGLHAFSSSNWLIGESFTLHAKQKSFSALTVIHAQSGAVVTAETELSKIAVQVVMPAMLVHALQATLKHREEAFNSVGVDSAVNLGNILILSVAGETVTPIKYVVDAAVLSGLIGHYPSFTSDVLAQYWQDGGCLHIVDNNRTGLTSSAVYRRENFVLVVKATALLVVLGLDSLAVTDKGFIHFQGAATRFEHGKAVIAHGFADTVSYEPSRFEGDTKGAVQLFGANPLLAGRNQEDGLKRQMQRNMARFKNSAHFYSERLAAVVALVNTNTGRSTFKFCYVLHCRSAGIQGNVPTALIQRMSKQFLHCESRGLRGLKS